MVQTTEKEEKGNDRRKELEQQLPRAQPCQARLSAGKGSTIVVRILEYAR